MGEEPQDFVVKPDTEGVIPDGGRGLGPPVRTMLARMLRTPTTAANLRERYTFVYGLARVGFFNDLTPNAAWVREVERHTPSYPPAADWIQNCNTPANTVTEGLQLKASDFPPGVVYGHYSEGPVWRGRGERATEVLSAMRGATLKEAKDLALDTTTMDARYWAAPLVAAYDARRSTVEDRVFDLRAAADAVRNWDHRVVKESTGATVFHFWREEYHKLRPEAFGAAVKHKAFPQSPDEQADAFKALQAAVERMRELYGSVLVPWGRVLRLRRHGLDLPLDGSPGGVWGSEVLRSTGGSEMNEHGQIEFRGGQVVTSVVELTDPIRVWSIVPWGQSRKEGAVHATDQMRLYSASEMRPTWHDWASLRDQIESSKTYPYNLGE
ncbi:MAG: penicillin acylase family protein [Bryobacterales bacterium]|nr:penicillin acylase family protein [Bryobacterales bacterium]